LDPAATTITIFGQEYTIRGGDDPKYVQEIARYLDSRMREVSRNASQVSTVRVAILAALNITDELFRERGKETTPAIAERTQRLLASLEATIGAATPRTGTDARASMESGGETLPDA